MAGQFSANYGITGMNRRSIFVRALISFCLLIIASLAVAQSPVSQDQGIANKIFSSAFEQKLIDKPIGAVITTVGKTFLGTPYVGGVLDSSVDEHLVVNLHGLDCVTFVENTLALSRAIKSNTLSFNAFLHQVQSIRYRDSTINGYTSRLNYFTDWIADNVKKGILTDVTKRIGGVSYRKTINFMSRHRGSYKQLAVDSNYTAIQATEAQLASRSLYYIPKENLQRLELKIEDGDIIAITTSIDGLDISHTAIAVHEQDGSLHLLHAPDANGVVTITEKPLSAYLLSHVKQTGIMVMRPFNPEDSK